MNFIHFESGVIYRKKLLDSFCQECVDYNTNDILIIYNGVDYKFKKPRNSFYFTSFGII